MASRKTALLNNLSGSLFLVAERLFRHSDIAKVEARGERLGELLFRLDGKRRNRTYANLSLAFPEWSVGERSRVAKGVFRHFGLVAADFFRTPLRSAQELLDNVEVQGMENLYAAEKIGKGILVVTGHMGNWERFGHWATSVGRHLSVVARDANQSGIQDRVAKIREHTGIEVLSQGNSARQILTKLRQREMVALLPDQNANEVFVPFFGHPAGTVLGPAVLHQRTGAPLLPSYCVRTGVGKYRVIVLPAIDSENVVQDFPTVTTQLNAALESVIREFPEQWLWMHDRWKNARALGLLGPDAS